MMDRLTRTATLKSSLPPPRVGPDRPTPVEEQFLSLTRLSSDWYWETDQDGRVTFVSDGLRRVFGVGPEALLGKTRLEIAADQNDPGLLEYCRKVARREPFQDIEYCGIAPGTGETSYLVISGDPIFERGAFRGYRGVGRDISGERRSARKIAELAAENSALIDNALDLLAILDEDGRLLRINQSASDILGYAPDELKGRPYEDLLHPQDRPRAAMLNHYLRRGGALVREMEMRWLRKDGGIVHLSLSLRWLPVQRRVYASARDITGSHAIQAELQKSRNALSALIETMGDAFFAVSCDWRITYVNRKTVALIGREQQSLLGRVLWEAVPELLGTDNLATYRQAMESGRNVSFEACHAATGTWHEVRVYPYEDGLSVFFHDVTERYIAERAIRQSEQRLRDVIAMTPSGYLLADRDGTLLDVNPAFCAMSGYARNELLGRRLSMLLPDCPCDPAQYQADGLGAVHGREGELLHKDGHGMTVLLNANFSDAGGNAGTMTGFLTDITGRKQDEARMRRLATHDTLTGLPNRSLLNERLQQMLESAGEQALAVMFIDLDQFKKINDSMGHEPGDKLLCQVALRLRAMLQADGFVARLGGDEFVAVAPCPAGAASAATTAGLLLAALAAPFDIGAQEVFVSASIGVAMYPAHASTREELFQHADAAMYRAKAAGRNAWCFFEAEMSMQTRTRMQLEQALHRALERREFELHYQPRVDLRTMAVVGMEALIRWNHPQLGRVAPLDFIPIAEEKGLIEEIGAWVLKEACMQTGGFLRQFGRALRVSVNLSARQLRCEGLCAQVAAALDAAGLPPQLLELELTESALIEDMDVSARRLGELKASGIRIAVDDFGTGYSALAYLQRFPLDILKLDRSFINQQIEGGGNVNFIKAFIDLAHALNLSVVAEGIETAATLDTLRTASCDEGQGYLFAKPLSLAEFQLFLARLPAAVAGSI
jgi:diguanylate cyclase (GGDEF)-like protein/PAS domain S-box-containing protein